MKLLAWLSMIAGVPALLLLLVVVLGVPEWRSQVLSLSLPLDFSPDPLATVAFLPSIALASLALAAGAPAWRLRIAQAGLVLGAASWLGIFIAMGSRGLQTLF